LNDIALLNMSSQSIHIFISPWAANENNKSQKKITKSMGHHLPYGITQCYLPPDTSERTVTPVWTSHKSSFNF